MTKRQASAEPAQQLIVTWTAPGGAPQPIGRLSFDGVEYVFSYLAGVERIPEFRPLVGFPRLDEEYRSAHLFALFANKLMSRKRPDYHRYMVSLGLADDATGWEQLAASRGISHGNSIRVTEQIGEIK